MCGIDGVQTKIGQTPYFGNPFFGTSAAAPHIAGMAALLLEIDPTLTPAAIEALICGNAVDIGASGYDAVSGWGRADALATVTAAAAAVDLKAESDTGLSTEDNLTRLDNSAAGMELQFDVLGTIAGATVTVYAGGTAIGTAVAPGAVTTVVTTGAHDLPDGAHAITARQTEPGRLPSVASAALTLRVDTTAPTGVILPVSPDPCDAVISAIDFTFSEAVGEFDKAGLHLARDGHEVDLGMATLSDLGSAVLWRLAGLDGLTGRAGGYVLTLAAGPHVADVAGNPLAGGAQDEWLMNTILGTPGDDTICLAWDGVAARADVQAPGGPYLLDLAPFLAAALHVKGLAGDDTFVLDFAQGCPVPTGGIAVDGGEGADVLRLRGTDGEDTLALGGSEARLNGSAAVQFANVEEVAAALAVGATDANHVVVEAARGALRLAIEGGAGGAYDLVTRGASHLADASLVLREAADVTFDARDAGPGQPAKASFRLAALHLEDTSVARLEGDGSDFIKTRSLVIEEDAAGVPTATLDLTDNNLIVDYGESEASPLAAICRWIRAGYNTPGYWDGTGITSSVEAGDATSVLVKFTYWGDAQLDGDVDFDDGYWFQGTRCSLEVSPASRAVGPGSSAAISRLPVPNAAFSFRRPDPPALSVRAAPVALFPLHPPRTPGQMGAAGDARAREARDAMQRHDARQGPGNLPRRAWLGLAMAAVLGAVAGCAGPESRAPVPEGPPWWKGNVHLHSRWSDGADLPEMIADWYKSHGYHFIAVTDHNILQEGEKWAEVTKPETRASIAAARERFGPDWVAEKHDTVKEKDKQTGAERERARHLVRARPLAEYRDRFEEPGRFLLIMGEELSDRFERVQVHTNILNIGEVIPPPKGASVRETLANGLAAARAQESRLGRPMPVILNHPNWGNVVPVEDFCALPDLQFIEVMNTHPSDVYNVGSDVFLDTDRLWDVALARRLGDLGLGPIYGVAADDSHNAVKGTATGKGWIMVRTPALEADGLMKAMKAGDFYATTGVLLRDVRRLGDAIAVEVQPERGVRYRIQFIGTLRGYDRSREEARDEQGNLLPPTRRYSREIGQVLKEIKGTRATYVPTGRELYVRVRVVSSRMIPPPPPDPKVKFQPTAVPQTAWTQPVVIAPPP